MPKHDQDLTLLTLGFSSQYPAALMTLKLQLGVSQSPLFPHFVVVFLLFLLLLLVVVVVVVEVVLVVVVFFWTRENGVIMCLSTRRYGLIGRAQRPTGRSLKAKISPVPSHLGAKLVEPSTTNTCWPSRAQKSAESRDSTPTQEVRQMLHMQRTPFKSASKSSLNSVDELTDLRHLRLSLGTPGTFRCISQERQPLPTVAGTAGTCRCISQERQPVHLWNLGGFQLALWGQSLLHNRRSEHSVDELNLGRHPNIHLGLLELDLHGHRDVHNRETKRRQPAPPTPRPPPPPDDTASATTTSPRCTHDLPGQHPGPEVLHGAKSASTVKSPSMIQPWRWSWWWLWWWWCGRCACMTCLVRPHSSCNFFWGADGSVQVLGVCATRFPP